MAMIECPCCKGQISDRAEQCVHCGTLFIPRKSKRCVECGNELESGAAMCPKCGCPVTAGSGTIMSEPSPQLARTTDRQTPGKSKQLLVTLIVLLAVGTASTVGIIQYQMKKAVKEVMIRRQQEKAADEAMQRRREYAENLELATYTMLSGAADAETCCNLIQQVWNNAIWEKEDNATDKYTKPDGTFVTDFNEALDNLFSDPDFYTQIDDIMENQETVRSIIKELKNPPEEYKSAYESLSECYDAYLTFTNMAMNPSGSLNSFSTDFSDVDSKFMHCYQVMLFYLQG